ncbi:MAG: FKBP-type peptidyl-prolyl cis-trans isomerase [Prevotellaceae bacterium]|jgi:FKBP-type peptidyl-prolyl cis-trans isomerase|nr:FKBP-type peptidyl-prolyl cis-trans isomerase [Prevotellaceae bacterium]
MKKVFLLVAAIAIVLAPVEAKSKKKSKKTPLVEEVPAPLFTNDVDSMSYALGMNLGANFGENLKNIPGGKSNADLLIKGFATVLKGDSALMTQEFANEYFGSYITKYQQLEAGKSKTENAAYLEENKTKEGVQVTESGLQYIVVTPAEGAKPLATDKVKVHYEGFLINGDKFDSSVDRGEPIVFPLNQVIPGWTEGVQLMSTGAKYKFFIPYNLAYGEQGRQGAIPPYATLIFDVELLEINPAE